MIPCLMSMSPISMFQYLHLMSPYRHVTGIPPTENGTNGKLQFPFVCYIRKTETANFCLFAANRNDKRKSVFPWSTNFNNNRRLLFEQKCPSIQGGRGILTPF
jgi:hypothetical protein